MALRNTVTELLQIIPSAYTVEVLRSNFITNANTIVETYLVPAGIPESILKMIELYLAAHLVALTQEGGGIIKDSFGDSSTSFTNNFGKGLARTRFGEFALGLDTSGELMKIGTPLQRAEFRVI